MGLSSHEFWWHTWNIYWGELLVQSTKYNFGPTKSCNFKKLKVYETKLHTMWSVNDGAVWDQPGICCGGFLAIFWPNHWVFPALNWPYLGLKIPLKSVHFYIDLRNLQLTQFYSHFQHNISWLCFDISWCYIKNDSDASWCSIKNDYRIESTIDPVTRS